MAKIEIIKNTYADDGYGGKVPTQVVQETVYGNYSPLKQSTMLKDYGRVVRGGIVIYLNTLITTQGEIFVNLNSKVYTVIERVESSRKGVYVCEVYSR